MALSSSTCPAAAIRTWLPPQPGSESDEMSDSAVSAAFGKAAAENRAALIGYLPAGFPDKDTGIRAALAMAEGGADVIEVGLPYSDPLMDGPVIADAVYQSLKGGTRVKDVLDTVEAISNAGTAALIMTYWNPVDHYRVSPCPPAHS